jgi:hypothetical protein
MTAIFSKKWSEEAWSCTRIIIDVNDAHYVGVSERGKCGEKECR